MLVEIPMIATVKAHAGFSYSHASAAHAGGSSNGIGRKEKQFARELEVFTSY
jgi:hypothetical protein